MEPHIFLLKSNIVTCGKIILKNLQYINSYQDQHWNNSFLQQNNNSFLQLAKNVRFNKISACKCCWESNYNLILMSSALLLF